jgi:hypothetical protein
LRPEGAFSPNLWVAASTLIAAAFVAVQAWYARVAFVEASASRLLENKLDACFDSYDAAAALDAELRAVSGDPDDPERWPPTVVPQSRAQALVVQDRVVPAVERLDALLMKSSILGPLGTERAYLLQNVTGLGERLRAIDPGRVVRNTQDGEVLSAFASLSELIGAQHLVLLGCRDVAGTSV